MIYRSVMNHKIMPTSILLVSLLVMLGLHFGVPWMQIVPAPWNVLGVLPLILGIIINILADNALKKARTTVKLFMESHSLVTGNVYSFSRHPMYLGFALILLGAAVLLRTLSPYFVVFVFILLMELLYIHTEEEMMAHTFGETWQAYRHKVRRWI
jgi:protein-S-isoprenylcysteine O-methyltransferase Ste14